VPAADGELHQGGALTRVTVAYRTHAADRYNWNPGMPAGGELGDTKDDEMLSLHQAGLAREFDMRGSSAVHIETVTPSAGPSIGTDPDPRPHAGSGSDPGRVVPPDVQRDQPPR
jgi:hypothetical protein